MADGSSDRSSDRAPDGETVARVGRPVSKAFMARVISPGVLPFIAALEVAWLAALAWLACRG
jgi:hypothetical protein